MQKREFLKGGISELSGLGLMGMAQAAERYPAAKDIKWDETWEVIVVGGLPPLKQDSNYALRE